MLNKSRNNSDSFLFFHEHRFLNEKCCVNKLQAKYRPGISSQENDCLLFCNEPGVAGSPPVMKSESRQEKSPAVVIQDNSLERDGDYLRTLLEGVAGHVALHIDDHEAIGGVARVAVHIQMQRRQ